MQGGWKWVLILGRTLTFFPHSYLCERYSKAEKCVWLPWMLMIQGILGDTKDAMRPNTLNRAAVAESKERPGRLRYPNYTSLPSQSPTRHPSCENALIQGCPWVLRNRLIKLCYCSHPQNKRSQGKYFGVKLVFFFSYFPIPHISVCLLPPQMKK